MRWHTKPFEWKKRFALLPICIIVEGGCDWVWLEFYWAQECGEYTITKVQKERPSE